MTLAAHLVEWAKDRPDWQKAALAAFCKNAEYTEDKIKTVAEQLIARTFPATPDLTVDDVPGGSSTGDRVLLTSLGEVAGANALVDQQTLSFAETGLTVIYGHNASGKSGYARLLSSGGNGSGQVAVQVGRHAPGRRVAEVAGWDVF